MSHVQPHALAMPTDRAQQIQYLIGAVFLILGGWCLFDPTSVAALGFRPETNPEQPIVALIMGCFGAQAVLAGLIAMFSTFTRRTFIALGIAIIPFFWFDYYFYAVEPVMSPLIALDAVGNVILIALCAWGARTAHQ